MLHLSVCNTVREKECVRGDSAVEKEMEDSGDMASQDTQQQQQQGEKPRKRKQKFSEAEQEVLIQEMLTSHESLFGKNSLRVPETRKRRLWADIQQKVNAVGVTHRSVDDLRKRWYDMRNRTKEKVATRLKEAKKTGGGPSTATDPTPQEEQVEATLLPESVMGVGDLDSSDYPEPGQAPSGTQPPGSGRQGKSPTREAAGQEEETEEEASPVNPTRRRRRNIVAPLPPLEDEVQDTDGDVQSDTTPPEPRHRPHAERNPVVPPRRRPRAHSSAADPGDDSVFCGLELHMLQVQRLQAKNIKSLQREVRAGFGGMTGALEALCAELKADRAARRREMQRLDLYTRAVNRLSSATNALARRSICMQREVAHNSQDVARALVQITSAVDELRAVRTTGSGVLTPNDEDTLSGRSSPTPPPTMERRRSGRTSRLSGTGEEGTVRPQTGTSSRQRRM